MKKISVVILSAVALFLSSNGESSAQTVFKLAYNAPPPVIGPVADKFSEAIATKTKNQFQVKSFGGGQLGSNTQNFAQIKTGQIDMLLIGSNLLGIPKGGKDFEILSLPYLFKDQKHFRGFVNSSLFRKMIEDAEKEGGFKFLGYLGDRAPRQLTSNRPVSNLEDLKGLKVRVPDSKPIVEAWKAWGAAPISISASELYTALKQGVVDGQDNGFDAIAQSKYYEVQKYVATLDYIRWGLMVLMNLEQWNKLSPDQKKALEEAALETDRFATSLSDETVAQSIDILKKHGMEILTPKLEPLKDRLKTVKEKLDGELWAKGLYEQIQAID